MTKRESRHETPEVSKKDLLHLAITNANEALATATTQAEIRAAVIGALTALDAFLCEADE